MPPSPPSSRTEILRGTLDMLVLRTLSASPMHGYGIAKHLEQVSGEVFRVEQGSLYPALQRMLQKDWISAEWRQTPNNQSARYYSITRAGRKQLGIEESAFELALAAIRLVMQHT
jgi:PadR family transcriptional regulator, regulatory protein PadR